MKHRSFALAAALALVAAAPAWAQEHGMAPVQGRQATITGTVVDVSCLVGSGATGEGHRQCALVCADAGLPLAIADERGRVYMALAAAPGQSTNARLREHAEHRVRVTGTVIESHGVRGIKIDTIALASATR
jgi:hypothetical protein